MVESSNSGNFGIQQSTDNNDGSARVGTGGGSAGGSGGQQQMSRAGTIGPSGVAGSALVAGGSQQQQQQQQRDQQQQQSARTLRLLTAIIQPQNIDTVSAAQMLSHGQAYQRIAPSTADRQQQQIAMSNNYNSMPFVPF